MKKTILLFLVTLLFPIVYGQIFTVTETELLEINISVTDPDGDLVNVIYSAPLNEDGMWQTTYDDAGEYKSVVKISDGTSVVEEEINIIVLNKNRLPVLNKIPTLNVKEGKTLTYNIDGFDPDDEKTILSWFKIPKGSKIKNRIFNFTPSYNFVENPKPTFWNRIKLSFFPYKEAYTFKLGLNDSIDMVFQNVTVYVTNVNRAPVIIKYIPVKEAKVGEIIKLGVIAQDPDEDELSYDWNFGFFDSVNGDNIIYRKFTKPGIKLVKVKVSDGYRTSVRTWKINVV